MVVIGFNRATKLAFPVAAWSFSSDGGMTWTTRTEGTTPFFPGAPSTWPLLSDGTRYLGTSGDPLLFPTGHPNQVAYVTTAVSVRSNAIGKPNDIVMFISNDGGRTFGPNGTNCGPQCFFAVSDSSSNGATGDQPGFADQPIGAFPYTGSDYSLNAAHVAWIGWKNRNGPAAQGLPRNWLSRVHFMPDGSVSSAGYIPPREVRVDCNLACTAFDSANIAVACLGGQNAVDNCGDQSNERLLLAFPKVNNGTSTDMGSNQTVNCPSASADPPTGTPTFDVDLRVAISADQGSTWKKKINGDNSSVLIDHDPIWPSCVDPAAWGEPGGNNRVRPTMFYDDQNAEWHVLWNRTLVQAGTSRGQRVWDLRADPDIEMPFLPPFEVSPHLLKLNGTAPCNMDGSECISNQFSISASWRSAPFSSIEAVAWHDTRLTANPSLHTLLGTTRWNGGWVPTPIALAQNNPSGIVPWSSLDPIGIGGGNTPWGDYESMACSSLDGCFPAWADTRDNGGVPSIHSVNWQP